MIRIAIAAAVRGLRRTAALKAAPNLPMARPTACGQDGACQLSLPKTRPGIWRSIAHACTARARSDPMSFIPCSP